MLVWGEGGPFDAIPASAKIILLTSYVLAENDRAQVTIPISIQTERNGHYTNFEGVVSAFAQCVPKRPAIADAEPLFQAIRAASAQFVGTR